MKVFAEDLEWVESTTPDSWYLMLDDIPVGLCEGVIDPNADTATYRAFTLMPVPFSETKLVGDGYLTEREAKSAVEEVVWDWFTKVLNMYWRL